jgi:CRP-like cAMP-binding protein
MGEPVGGMRGRQSGAASDEALDAHHGADEGDEQALVLARWARQHGVARDLQCDATLFAQGHACRELYWLERGWVTLLRSEGTGADIIIGFRGSGTLLGAGALMAHAAHANTAMTRTAVRAWYLHPDTLDAALGTDARLRRAVFTGIILEASEHAARCGALGCLDARQHLERLLLHYVARHTGAGPSRVPLTTGEIAGLLGIDLSHACRLLRAMKRQGLIEISRGWIVVPDPTRFDTRRAS